MTVQYEWDIETVEAGTDPEVLDHYHHDKLAQTADTLGKWHPDAAHQILIVLVRDDDYGRQWAYIEAGRMPDQFDEGTAVPRRFQLEWDKYGEQVNAQVDAINGREFAPRTESNSVFLDKMKEREAHDD